MSGQRLLLQARRLGAAGGAEFIRREPGDFGTARLQFLVGTPSGGLGEDVPRSEPVFLCDIDPLLHQLIWWCDRVFHQ